jgi:tetratricopeptide (TPR) repeat protein
MMIMTMMVTLETFMAEERLRRELAENPDDAGLLRDLAALCLVKNQPEEAAELTGRLLAAHPGDPEGSRLRLRVAAMAPDGGEARLELGRLAEERRDWAAAVEAYHPCAERDLSDRRAVLGLARALAGQRRFEEAARAVAGLCAHGCLHLGEYLVHMADYLRLALHPDDALAVTRVARLLFPDNGLIAEQHARSLVNAGHPGEGLREVERARSLGRDGFAIHLTRSAAHHLQGRLDDARAECDAALACCPGDETATMNRTLILMAQGRWEEGWSGYETRLRSYAVDLARLWDGGEVDGDLLVMGEQGLGDQVQCLRYIPLIRPLVRGRLIVQLAEPLLRLARESIPGVDEWVSLSLPLAPHHRVIPMMSLARLLDGGIPGTAAVPFPVLRAPAAAAAPLPAGPGLKVGICWAGGPGYLLDSIRSMPAAEVARLVRRFPGIRFVRLQRGPVGSHVGEVSAGLPLEDGVGNCADYADTAAVIDRLDLVISVDTSLAHVAASLGKETWILLPHVACFRWGQTGERTPLYPSVTLIRQPRCGEGWGEAMDEVTRRLDTRLGR